MMLTCEILETKESNGIENTQYKNCLTGVLLNLNEVS